MRMTRLRELREDRNMSQQTLADLVNTSQQNIYKYENGITEPDIQMLKALADVFHTSIDYLVEYDAGDYRKMLSSLFEKTENPAEDYAVNVPADGFDNHIDGDTLHLLVSYEKCQPHIKEHILYIISELSRIPTKENK
ncbi:MAG: helix-turn-helix transcriptional regulator [Eubacterium sp.]|nr:helix-turn-helix transcriptional regulator [Eubacterium sp.]